MDKTVDEAKLVEEISKIVADQKNNFLLSDLVKVGIPSLVAIISGIITYRVSINATKVSVKVAELAQIHGEKLAQLSIDHEKSKVIDERRNKLIEYMSDGLMRIIDEYSKYLEIISTKGHIEEKREVISKHIEECIIDRYNSSGGSFDDYYNKIYSQAILLGNSELISELDQLRVLLVHIQSDCSFDTTLPWMEIVAYKDKLNKSKRKLFELLGEEFNCI